MISRNFMILYFLALLFCACKDRLVHDAILVEDSRIISYQVDQTKKVQFFLKDEKGNNFLDFETLNTYLDLKGTEMYFVFNGGMYKKDRSPQGLYIEKGKIISPMDTLNEGFGNFYLQPNGIFSIDKAGKGEVIETSGFSFSKEILYATQSGPMLLIDGKMHPKFRKGSSNLNIRNGVGILPNGNILLAISNTEINLYDFANFFSKNGCVNALYLDGFVSKVYYPPLYNQEGGKFGVMIAVVGETTLD